MKRYPKFLAAASAALAATTAVPSTAGAAATGTAVHTVGTAEAGVPTAATAPQTRLPGVALSPKAPAQTSGAISCIVVGAAYKMGTGDGRTMVQSVRTQCSTSGSAVMLFVSAQGQMYKVDQSDYSTTQVIQLVSSGQSFAEDLKSHRCGRGCEEMNTANWQWHGEHTNATPIGPPPPGVGCTRRATTDFACQAGAIVDSGNDFFAKRPY